jgi:hypothetical protein
MDYMLTFGKIVDKVRAAQRKNRVPSPPSKQPESWVAEGRTDIIDSTTSRPLNELQLVPAFSTIELPPNRDDLAVGYFFHHYVHDFRQDNSVWYIDDGNGCLVSSIKAVGIAGMMRVANGPSFSPEAQQQYLHAIQLTTAALGSPDLAKLHSTLLTINVLSIFESISGFHRSMNTWRDHINGASVSFPVSIIPWETFAYYTQLLCRHYWQYAGQNNSRRLQVAGFSFKRQPTYLLVAFSNEFRFQNMSAR